MRQAVTESCGFPESSTDRGLLLPRTCLVQPSVHFSGLIAELWADRDVEFCMSFFFVRFTLPKNGVCAITRSFSSYLLK